MIKNPSFQCRFPHEFAFIFRFFSKMIQKCRQRRALYSLNIQSSFTVQNPRAQLVKIEHVILLYLTSPNSDSALLTITHKNRALLTMASADRFTEIVEEQIPQIINEAIYPQIPRGKQTGALLFSNEAIPKFVDFGNARFENAILRSLITCQRKAVDLSQSR